MDNKRYAQYQEESIRRYEFFCRRCGRCCGAGGEDPCRNLVRQLDGRYKCQSYENRLGGQMTVKGNEFNCVPIREVLKFNDVLPDCAYRKP